jgi:hypothetical protein
MSKGKNAKPKKRKNETLIYVLLKKIKIKKNILKYNIPLKY